MTAIQTIDTGASVEIEISHDARPQHADVSTRTEQVIFAITGERPLWVHYNPASVSAVAHLWNPRNSSRYLLGAAGYRHHQTIDTGEIWTRPHTKTEVELTDPSPDLDTGASL